MTEYDYCKWNKLDNETERKAILFGEIRESLLKLTLVRRQECKKLMDKHFRQWVGPVQKTRL